MRQVGGKGKIGLWLLAFRNPLAKTEHGFTLEGGFLLDVTYKRAWLLSFGIKGIGTLGFGWVTKNQRREDAAFAARAAEHEQMHADGVEHAH